MDDSDDYIVDDIALDDETLALLDREEQKYLSSQKNLFADAPPVNKKRKTETGWKPGLVHGWDDTDDFENLPEISVRSDGTYSVRDDTVAISTPPAPSNPNVDAANGRNVTRTTPMTPVGSLPEGAIEADNWLRQSTDYLAPRNLTIQRHSCSSAEGSKHGAPREQILQELQQNMQELYAENQRMQLALKQATDMKLMKDGEVTILRKGVERAAQEHAAQIANMKAVKEEAEAKQAQIQKEMKEEIERIKTQLLFKELESSLRRVPPSVRANKIYEDPLRTPIRRFSQKIANDTPVYNDHPASQVQQFNFQHAETPRLRRALKSPRNQNRTGALPGFHNAFVTPRVVQPQPDIFEPKSHPPSSPLPNSPPSSPTRHETTNPIDHSSSARPVPSRDGHQTAVVENASDPMAVEEDEDVQPPEETVYQPVNWMSELSRIVLTHTLPESSQPTLQLMLAISPAPLETDSIQFAALGSEILHIIANFHVIQDYANAVRCLCSPLTTMLLVVGKSDQHHSIRSLINLLTVLTFSLPEFGTHLLSQANGSSHSPCVGAIREIIILHLGITNRLESFDSLAHEMLSFLEVVCLRAQEDATARLAPLVLDDQVWATLLHTAQPERILTRVCELLVFFGSNQVLARGLLNVPNASASMGDKSPDSGEALLIDRLCTLLNEAKEPDKCQAMKDHILTFIATLSVSQADSLATLINNDYLIPSLVCFLSNLTGSLWEDSEGLTTTSPTLATLIHMTNQTITLIHHLVFAAGRSFNLRLRLHHNQRRALTGLHHMFIVSCGRLSYADPPAFINDSGRHELESVSDLARGLLELVVDGPESDSIWSLYQEDPDQNESETDEGEMEARLLGD